MYGFAIKNCMVFAINDCKVFKYKFYEKNLQFKSQKISSKIIIPLNPAMRFIPLAKKLILYKLSTTTQQLNETASLFASPFISTHLSSLS